MPKAAGNCPAVKVGLPFSRLSTDEIRLNPLLCRKILGMLKSEGQVKIESSIAAFVVASLLSGFNILTDKDAQKCAAFFVIA